MAKFAIDDQMAESHAMVNLVEQGWADQNDVARVFGCSPRTVRRYQRRYAAGGLAGMGRAGGFPRGRRRPAHSREKLILRMKTQGLPNREIARRLGVTPKAIRKLLKRLGWRNPVPEQIELPIVLPAGDPNMSAFSSAGAVPSREAALPRPVRF
jgi:transposase